MQIQIDTANKLELAKYNNKDVGGAESDDSYDTDEIIDQKMLKKVDKIEQINIKRQKVAEEQEFINPLVATKKDIKRMKNKGKKPEELKQKANPKDDSDLDDFESDVDDLADQLDKQHEEEQLKKKKREKKKKSKEEVPETFEEVRPEKNFSDYDSDDIAEIRAIGKHLLRKKDRINFLESCYNKNAYDYDPSILPSWFLEEEKKYNQPIIPITKEEIAAEKKYIKEYNSRPSAKVAEFKLRKRRRMLNAMKKVREKANVIANSDELNAKSKMRQIKKLHLIKKNGKLKLNFQE